MLGMSEGLCQLGRGIAGGGQDGKGVGEGWRMSSGDGGLCALKGCRVYEQSGFVFGMELFLSRLDGLCLCACVAVHYLLGGKNNNEKKGGVNIK